MTVTWRAPGRVNLIGEHTDHNDGFVLPFALPLGVTARVTGRDDGVLRVTSATYDEPVDVAVAGLEPGTVDGWAAYVAGVVWSLRKYGHPIAGADVHLESDLPVGAGLSSSAAVECSTAGALAEAYGIALTDAELVQVARTAENDFVGVPSGVLDQSASVLCRRGRVLFLDARSLETRQVPLPLTQQGLRVLVMDTRTLHRLADGEYAQRRSECRQAAERLGLHSLRDVVDARAALDQLSAHDVLLRRARHVFTENDRVLQTVAALEVGQYLRAVGPLLTASHVSLRDDFQVSCRELDLAVDTALGAGALGARMTGGGFGGSAIALVERADAARVAGEVTRAFVAAGLREPTVFAAVPSDGAHRTPD
ncbi:MAG: galactokinase [Actinomycetota bacterium]